MRNSVPVCKKNIRNGWLNRIKEMVEENNVLNNDTTNLPYKLHNGLFYFNNPKSGIIRLCIPELLEKKVFELIYNELGYSGYKRTLKKLTKCLYILNLFKKLHKFIK